MKEAAQKAFYAMVGAPVLAYEKTVEMSGKFAEGAKTEFDAAAKEGEKVAKKVRTTNLADEFSSRMDLDNIQDRVEKLRDQLDDAVAQWHENFRPGDAEVAEKPAPKKAPASKPAAKKTTTKTTAAKKPAAKKAPARKPAAKKTPVEGASA